MPKITKDKSVALRGLKKTTKRVTAQLNDTKGFGGNGRGKMGKSIMEAGDDLVNFTNMESAKRKNRPKDDPFHQIGL